MNPNASTKHWNKFPLPKNRAFPACGFRSITSARYGRTTAHPTSLSRRSVSAPAASALGLAWSLLPFTTRCMWRHGWRRSTFSVMGVWTWAWAAPVIPTSSSRMERTWATHEACGWSLPTCCRASGRRRRCHIKGSISRFRRARFCQSLCSARILHCGPRAAVTRRRV